MSKAPPQIMYQGQLYKRAVDEAKQYQDRVAKDVAVINNMATRLKSDLSLGRVRSLRASARQLIATLDAVEGLLA